MKLTNRSVRIRLGMGMALGALVLTVAGSPAAVAAPAPAAESDHCVVTVPETSTQCFATFDEAKAFADSMTGSGSAMRVSVVIWPLTVLVIAYDLANFNAANGTLILISLNGPCTKSIANVDHQVANLPAGWDNRISSYIAGPYCWTKLFRDPNFGGPSVGFAGDTAMIGGGLNNNASSIQWS
ncbi:MAG TPA: hypothetical protein VFC19_01310 [Candidatus Limnocylindrales bacterium]|nr:hypothetical protein [Candidatus Limnocylindrales bacterium]